MAIKASNLKQHRIRKVITTINNGEVEQITIYNPTGVTREGLHQFIVSQINDGVTDQHEISKNATNAIENIFVDLTDIEFDEETSFSDLLEFPSEAILKVHFEIQTIIHELILEILINQHSALDKAYQQTLSQFAKVKQENLIKIQSELGVDENGEEK